MEYAIDVNDRVRGKITNRCRIQIIREVYDNLDVEHRAIFAESCFGHLLKIAHMKVALQIVHHVLLRLVSTPKENEVWFKFGNKLSRFGLEEFTLITGLKSGELEFEDESLGLQCQLVKKYFKKNKGKITRKQLLTAFQKCSDQADKLKLGLLLIVAYVLLATEENTNLNLWWFYLVADPDRFNKYAWGKRSYQYTITIFKGDLGKRVKQYKKNDRYPYNLHGFPHSIMIWAFEAIPTLGQEFAHKLKDEIIPRMLRWEIDQPMLEGKKVDLFLEYDIINKNLEVNRTLVPSSMEGDTEFCQGMTPFDGVEDSKVDDNLIEDGVKESGEDAPSLSTHHQQFEQSSSSSSSQQNDIAEAIIKEMRELEKRLQHVINERFDQLTARCDRMENKLDRVLQLLEKCEFQPDVNGFHTDAHSGGNFPEASPRQQEEHLCREWAEGKVSNPSTAMRAMVVYQDPEISAQPKMSAKSFSKGEFVEPAILVEDDMDEESVKGRGHRVKMPSRALCSPFTDPIKRRKLLDVKVFEPFRDVDPTKVSDLFEWLEKASASDILPLAICDVGRKFFDDLLNEDGWLIDDHVDSALFHIRERAATYEQLFRQDCGIMDSTFWQYVRKAYCQMENRGRRKLASEFSKELVNYVKGVSPRLGKPWSACRRIYFPYCVPGSHWFAIEVDLNERLINIFDSLPSIVRESQLAQHIKPIQVVIPWLMKLYVNEAYNTSMLKYNRVKTLPEQNNGSDCGIFAVKFIEFSLAGIDLSLVAAKDMKMWRQKMAVEIFARHFDP